MVQIESCKDNYSKTNAECRKEVACNVFTGDKCDEARKKCEKIVVDQLKGDCQNELKKVEDGCEKKAKQEFEEKKGKIESECKEMIEKLGKPCEIFQKECSIIKEKCHSRLEDKHNKETAEEMIKCKHEEGFIKLGDAGKLYIKEALDIFYPELGDKKDTINKIENGTYFVRQFGMDVNNLDNGGSYYSFFKKDPVTYTGNIDKSCFFNTSENISVTESYSIKHNDGPVECYNQILDSVKRKNTTLNDEDYTHLQIVKVAKDYSNINKCKPVATVSQKEPLIIANSENGKLVTKDGTVTDVTHDTYTQFCDKNGRILDCTGKGEDCKVCQNSIWDFQGEVNVYTNGGCLLL